MNISKKAIMSFFVALTSVVSMAQPYYHIMKEVNGKLTEDTVFNGKHYDIRIDMVDEKKPIDAIGNKITIESYDCDDSPLKRSFYFTNKGNVYYSSHALYFEKSQLDCSNNTRNHIGLFRWGRTVDECISKGYNLYWSPSSEQDFYFANPEKLAMRRRDKRKWAVLSACEWRYVCEYLGECGWKVDGKTCFLIDTTPGKSLLRTIESKNKGKFMSKDDFEYYEAKGLVCLPATGWYWGTNNYSEASDCGYYWSCTPTRNRMEFACIMHFSPWSAYTIGYKRADGHAVRLVVLAN